MDRQAMTLEKTEEAALKAHGWCHLNNEIAFLANKLAELEKEVKALKRKLKKDE